MHKFPEKKISESSNMQNLFVTHRPLEQICLSLCLNCEHNLTELQPLTYFSSEEMSNKLTVVVPVEQLQKTLGQKEKIIFRFF